MAARAASPCTRCSDARRFVPASVSDNVPSSNSKIASVLRPFFAGIGNAYSDEILHRARLSPIFLTKDLQEDEIRRLHVSTIAVLNEWSARLKTEKFPEKVTAFREGMAVHGRYRQPCPVCGSPVQRIVYAENETNYCARCQTGGKILADRALSRLLKKSWPRNIDELE